MASEQVPLSSRPERRVPARFLAVAAVLTALLTLATFMPALPGVSAVTGGDTPTAEAMACPPTIAEGSTGSWVVELQQELNSYPYDVSGPWLDVDGIFGPKTENGVRLFQQYFGLTVDGIVGPQTWGTLGYC